MRQQVKLEAINLRGNRYAVMPEGRLGTCGFYPVPWTVQYITARNAEAAVRKAKPIYYRAEADSSATAGLETLI